MTTDETSAIDLGFISRETILDHAESLHHQGFSTVPVSQHKAPIRYGWRDEVEVNRRPPNEDEYLRDNRVDGVGVITGQRVVSPRRNGEVVDGYWLCAIDVDVYNEDLSAKLEDYMCSEILGLTEEQQETQFRFRVGQDPKWLMPFFLDKKSKKLTSAAYSDGSKDDNGKPISSRIEVLGDGQQFVAYGNHRKAGQKYVWYGEYTEAGNGKPYIRAKHFPRLGMEQVRQFLDYYHQIAEEAGLSKVGDSVVNLYGNDLPDSDDIDFDLLARLNPKLPITDLSEEKMRGILGEYPAQNLDYDRWLAVGMAIYHQTGGKGYEYWLEWSKRSDKHDESFMRRKWESFDADSNQRTFASVIKWHNEYMRTEQGQEAKFEAVLEEAKTTQYSAEADTGFFTSLDDNTYAEPRRQEWLIRGVMEKGQIGAIYGPPKTGKSFLALDMACHLAHGMDWCGMRVPEARDVWYIAGEGHIGIERRVDAWRLYHNITGRTRVFISNRNVVLANEEQFAKFRAKLHLSRPQDRPGMIVLDTYSRVMGGEIDENSNSETAQFIRKLDKLCQEYGVALVIVHHTPKGDATILRGAGSLQGALDFSMSVENAVGQIKVTSRDVKDGSGFADLYFSLISMELPKSHYIDNLGDGVSSAYLMWDTSARAEKVADKTGLSANAKAVLSAFEAAWKATDKRVPTPDDLHKAHAMDIESEGLDVDVVRDWFNRSNANTNPTTRRSNWSRGIAKLEENKVLFLFDDVLVRGADIAGGFE